jgi:hypothetical protein
MDEAEIGCEALLLRLNEVPADNIAAPHLFREKGKGRKQIGSSVRSAGVSLIANGSENLRER